MVKFSSVLLILVLTWATAGPAWSQTAPGFHPEKVWNPHAGFVPLNQPKMVAASEAKELHDDDVVFGIVVDGEARAYPHRLLWWHHIVNDVVGPHQRPVAVTY